MEPSFLRRETPARTALSAIYLPDDLYMKETAPETGAP
jgi:hypothetical protein